METIKNTDIKNIFSELKDIMVQNRDYLIKLDSALGDGDLGLTMSKGFSKIDEALKEYDEEKIGKIIAKAGMILSEASPSTLGTLIADGLIKGGMAIKDITEANITDISLFFSEFVNRITYTGKALAGEKTIVDSLHPAVESLKEASLKNMSFKDSFEEAYEKAKQGFLATEGLIAKYGRAKRYGKNSIGSLDPGAAAGMFFVQGFYNYFQKNN